MAEGTGGAFFRAMAGAGENELQAALDQFLQQPVSHQTPTVFVGLGGTGLKVLARLRQRIYQRYGDADRWPHYAFLAIDTDKRDLEKGGEANRKGMRVPASDQVNISMEPKEVQEVLENLGPNGTYAHMGRWLPTQARSRYRTFGFTEGANQIRAAGRMLLIYHLKDKVAPALRERCQRVRSANAIRTSQDRGATFAVAAPPTDVVIVGSIAGGTGSGTFLDFAYLARYLARREDQPIGEVRGMLLLPDVFTEEEVHATAQPIIHANGYAALRELEFYSGRYGQPFPVKAWGRSWLQQPFDDKPFNVCYLLSRQNGSHLDSSDEIYDLLADALAFSIGGTTLAATMRSNWANAQRFVNNGQMIYGLNAATKESGGPDSPALADAALPGQYALFERRWSTSFSSLGIASVSMKLPELRRVAAVRQLRRLIDFELGEEPKPEEVLRQHQAAARAILNQGGFVPLSLREDVNARVAEAAGSATAGQAADEARALLDELSRIAGAVQNLSAHPEAVVADLHAEAVKLAATNVGANLRLLGGAHRPAAYLTHEVIAELERETPSVGELGEVDVRDVSIEQWANLDGAGVADAFGLGTTAREIIRRKFSAWLTGAADGYLRHVETSLKRHYLTRSVQLLNQRKAEVDAGIQQLTAWAGELGKTQDGLVTLFQESRNRVLTGYLAAPTSQPQAERLLDEQIDAALGRKFGGTQFTTAERFTMCRDRALLWLRSKHPQTPGTLLDTKLQVAPQHPDVLQKLTDYLAETLLEDLPSVKDVFQLLRSQNTDLQTVLPDVQRRAVAYWPLDTSKKEFNTFGPVKLACAVVSPQPTPDQVRAKDLLWQDGKWRFVPDAETTPGAPRGELILVNEAHGFSIPSFSTIQDWRNKYETVMATAEGPDRHLDRALGRLLPHLTAVSGAEAELEIASWDTAMLGILLGYFDWSEAEGSYIYRPDQSMRIPAGDSYESVARWLRSPQSAGHYEQLSGLIEQDFSGRISRAQRPGGAGKAAEAAAQAWALKQLDLVLELLMTKSLTPEDADDQQIVHYPADHVMVRRLRGKIRERYLAELCRWAGRQESSFRAELVHDLHRYVRFVGPAPAAGAPGGAAGPAGASPRDRGKRILQLVVRGGADGAATAQAAARAGGTDVLDRDAGRDVLHEAWRLGWYSDMHYSTPELLKTLFPLDSPRPELTRPEPRRPEPGRPEPTRPAPAGVPGAAGERPVGGIGLGAAPDPADPARAAEPASPSPGQEAAYDFDNGDGAEGV